MTILQHVLLTMLALLSAVFIIASCGTRLGSSASRYKYYIYVGNQTSNDITAYELDPFSGKLKLISTTPASPPFSMVADPGGRFLFSACQTTNTITTFSIDPSSGNLKQLYSTVTAGPPRTLGTDASGQFLFDATFNANAYFEVYPITLNGAVSRVGLTQTNQNSCNSVTLSPDQKYIYVSSVFDNTLNVFNLDFVKWNNTLVQTLTVNGGPTGTTIDPSGRFLFLSQFFSNAVSSFSRNSDTGFAQTLSSVSTQAQPASIALDNPWLYVSYGYLVPPAGISTFSFDSSGTLSFVSDFPLPSSSVKIIALDPTKQFLFATDYSNNQIYVFATNNKTGALTQLGYISTGTNPDSIAVARVPQ